MNLPSLTHLMLFRNNIYNFKPINKATLPSLNHLQVNGNLSLVFNIERFQFSNYRIVICLETNS